MARIGVQIEATEESTQQTTGFANLPDGDYRLEITASAVPESGEGTPDHKLAVNVTIDVVEPDEYKGRKIFANYNLINPKTKDGVRLAEQIGNRQFSCLMRALGRTDSPSDSEDLHFVTFMAKVGTGKDSKEKNADGTPQYPARNEIKQYYYPDQGLPEPSVAVAARPANDNKPAARPAAAASAGAGAAAGGVKKNPWSK